MEGISSDKKVISEEHITLARDSNVWKSICEVLDKTGKMYFIFFILVVLLHFSFLRLPIDPYCETLSSLTITAFQRL